jgi:Tir chaperone protein (CesT) family
MDALELGLLEFCKNLGLADVNISDQEVSLLVSDFLVTLEIDKARGEVVMFAGVTEINPSEDELRHLLELNHLGQRTEGFGLSLEPGTNLVVLTHRLNAHSIQHGHLDKDFDRFVAVLERWRDGFGASVEPADDEATSAKDADWIRI